MNSRTDHLNECSPVGGNRCELEENLAVLRGVEAFSSLPIQRLKLYAYVSRRLCYRAGEFLFHQGASDDLGYIVIKGKLQIVRELRDRSVLLHELKEGDFFGGLALLSNVPRLFSVKALTDVECLVMNREGFQKLLLQSPETAVKVLDVVIKRIVVMEEKLLQAQTCECVFG